MAGELNVTILSDVCTETFERLEDDIRDLLEKEGLEGVIEDFRTGNITRTRKEEMEKIKEEMEKREEEMEKREEEMEKREEKGCELSPDINVEGKLTIGEKVWFNDPLRCRLRICGWTKKQIQKLRRSKLIDLTLINHKEDYSEVAIHISEFTNKDYRSDSK